MYHVSTTSILDHHICQYFHGILYLSITVCFYTYRVTQFTYEEEGGGGAKKSRATLNKSRQNRHGNF
jgi:hypothetical protein